MSLVVVLILAVVWAVFLVPQVLRARAEKTPSDSIGAFRDQLLVLERTTPGSSFQSSSVPMYRPMATTHSARDLARKRRRDITSGLLLAMAGSLVLGLIPALRVMLLLHVVLDLLFATYVGLLIRARNVSAERDVKVHYLPGPSLTAEQPLLLRRSGS